MLILLSSINSSKDFGRCSIKKTAIPVLDINNYLGLWYEQARDNETPFQKGDCASAVYSEEENKYYVVNSEDRNGERSDVKGTITWPNPPKGSLLVNFGPNQRCT